MSWSISPRRVRRHCAMSLLRPCSPPLQRLHQTKLQHDQCPTLPERLQCGLPLVRTSSRSPSRNVIRFTSAGFKSTSVSCIYSCIVRPTLPRDQLPSYLLCKLQMLEESWVKANITPNNGESC